MMIFNENKERMNVRWFLSKFNWIKLVKAKNGYFIYVTSMNGSEFYDRSSNVIRKMVIEKTKTLEFEW